MEFIVQRFGAVSSTNDIAIRMAEEGAPEGTVVVAGEQTAGRGRHGRNWSSPAGEGLYISVILRPDLPFDRLWQMAFIAAVSAAEAIRQASGLEARIKWPNDILLNDRKVCGILIEAASRQPPAASSQPPAASTRQQETGNWMPDAGNWQQLIHIDCYRLDSAKDTKSFNPEEFWSDPKNLVVIEWAERIRDILPRKRIDIKFKYLSDKKREITLNNLITQ